MYRDLIRSFLLFFIILLGVYFIHSWSIDLFSFPTDTRILNLSYIFNGLTVFVLVFGIWIVRHRLKDQLGFIFLAGSFIKLGSFVAITKLNGIEMNKSVFLDFFVAYVFCTVFEVYYISKILKSIN